MLSFGLGGDEWNGFNRIQILFGNAIWYFTGASNFEKTADNKGNKKQINHSAI